MPPPVIPPKTLDHLDRPIGCREAISEAVRAVADEALAKGWGREEITLALMEVANGWYFEAETEGGATKRDGVGKATALTPSGIGRSIDHG
jgi:hypothetical protein